MRDSQQIIKDILNAKCAAQIRGEELKEYDITLDEYRELAKHPALCTSFRPEPPVYAKGEISGGGGLFSSPVRGSFEARDYHAPEYLKALAAYEADREKDDRPMICGVRINVK